MSNSYYGQDDNEFTQSVMVICSVITVMGLVLYPTHKADSMSEGKLYANEQLTTLPNLITLIPF